MDYASRRQRLQAKLRRRKLSAMLVGQPENRRYLSGFSACDQAIAESSGFLFIPARGKCRLLTDFRYRLQAEQESDLEVLVYKSDVFSLLDRLLDHPRDSTLAFESHYLLHSRWLRLSALAEKRKLRLHPVGPLVEQLRAVKDEDEIIKVRESVQLNERVFSLIFSELQADMTELETVLSIETAMRRLGAEGPSFPTIVAAGENSARPHAVPGRSTLGTGRPVTIDMGLIYAGYCSDMTRNFVIGSADDTYLRLHRLVRRAQISGMAAVRAGITVAEVDRAARKIIADAGFGKYFGHALGHGVGLAVHELPRVSGTSRKKLKPGMIITIEPGIYLPGWGGVRLENLGVVREDGFEVLNQDFTWLDL